MIRILIALVMMGLPPLVAFTHHPNKIMTRRPATSLFYHPATFERAVDCAQNYGMCDVDELLNLAEELDEYHGCFYEDGAEACEKEIDDRRDLADVLLLQSELQHRNDYVKNGNLFAYEVKADKDMHDRDNFFNKIEDALDV